MDPLKPDLPATIPRSPRDLPDHRLPRWQRRALFATGAVLLLTGAVWLALHYTVGAGVGELPHPLEAWMLRLHGLAGFGGLFLFGVLAGAHIPRGWHVSRRRGWAGQRRSGAGLCALGAGLVATAYLLYYFAPETVRPALGWAHAGIGLVLTMLVWRHRRRTR